MCILNAHKEDCFRLCDYCSAGIYNSMIFLCSGQSSTENVTEMQRRLFDNMVAMPFDDSSIYILVRDRPRSEEDKEGKECSQQGLARTHE